MESPRAVVAGDQSAFSIDPSPYFQALMKVKRFAEILLHQQLWCLGKDIKVPENNLLIRYGLERIRPPQGTTGNSNYVVRFDGEVSLALWGFGIYYGYGKNQGVYIGRYNVYPKLIHDEPLSLPVWDPANLPEMKTPEGIEEWEYSFILISELLEWVARYEEWVSLTMAGSYRKECLKEWRQTNRFRRGHGVGMEKDCKFL